ncbi:hypothetical protein B0H63DRAFT_140873 [Podospora didyma]|uniref:Ubiquitin 3 binding protein But2 C-terminal domain-containing protein n=1 Tax=Podospora didyma TaxID=330526 RepID=A0AAE0NSF8_9PEZI|nr:hypothetical protein B0H63DRAFT_140873 [Podospora didyma]
MLPYITVLLSLFVFASASPTHGLRADTCTPPSWTIESATFIFFPSRDDIPGLAEVNVTSSVTRKTELIACPLQYNTLCRLDSTSWDPSLQVYLQVNLDMVIVTFTKTCDTASPTTADPSLSLPYALGSGMFEIVCSDGATGNNITCSGPVGGPVLIKGAVIVPTGLDTVGGE